MLVEVLEAQVTPPVDRHRVGPERELPEPEHDDADGHRGEVELPRLDDDRLERQANAGHRDHRPGHQRHGEPRDQDEPLGGRVEADATLHGPQQRRVQPCVADHDEDRREAPDDIDAPVAGGPGGSGWSGRLNALGAGDGGALRRLARLLLAAESRGQGATIRQSRDLVDERDGRYRPKACPHGLWCMMLSPGLHARSYRTPVSHTSSGPSVSVVIPARDAAATLPGTLAALDRQNGVPFEVIVVDDGSRDDTRAIAEAHRVVDAVVPLACGGISVARNAGVRRATAPVIAFTDADCYPAPDWLEQGMRALGDADLLQGRVVPERPMRPFERSIQVDGLTGLFQTANLFVRREAFDAVGGMEPGLIPRDGKEIGEDVCFGWRIRRAGYRVGYAHGVLVEHAVFERGPLGYVRARWTLWAFPGMAARVPEMREHVWYRRYFHSRRSALFDLAVLGAVLARATRMRFWLVLAVPYGTLTARKLRRTGPRHIPVVAAAQIAADTIGLIALLYGSAAHRSVLL